MVKAKVKIGIVYVVKVSGKLTRVKLISESPYGGWVGKNLLTGREVRIRTAAKLRWAVSQRCLACDACQRLAAQRIIVQGLLNGKTMEATMPVREEWRLFVAANPCITWEVAK